MSPAKRKSQRRAGSVRTASGGLARLSSCVEVEETTRWGRTGAGGQRDLTGGAGLICVLCGKEGHRLEAYRAPETVWVYIMNAWPANLKSISAAVRGRLTGVHGAIKGVLGMRIEGGDV